MNWYYEVWADTIHKARKSRNNKSDPEKMLTLLVAFSMAQGFNLLSIYFIISSFIKFNPLIELNLFPGNYLDIALSGFISFYLPFLLVNYFLVFHKRRFHNFIDKRKLNSEGKVFVYYFFGSGILLFTIILSGKLLS